MRIEQWSITAVQRSLYDPPEAQRFRLQGKVYGHPLHTDGKSLVTSDIVHVEGAHVETHSGSFYVLGEPNEKYVEWCREQGHHVPTPEEPIKIM